MYQEIQAGQLLRRIRRRRQLPGGLAGLRVLAGLRLLLCQVAQRLVLPVDLGQQVGVYFDRPFLLVAVLREAVLRAGRRYLPRPVLLRQ